MNGIIVIDEVSSPTETDLVKDIVGTPELRENYPGVLVRGAHLVPNIQINSITELVPRDSLGRLDVPEGFARRAAWSAAVR